MAINNDDLQLVYTSEITEWDIQALREDDDYADKSDDDLYEIMYEVKYEEYKDALDYLDTLFNGDAVTVTGTLGLWDGKHDIAPTDFYKITGAIASCVDDMDSVEIKMSEDNKVVYISAYHHDGCNCFEIRKKGGSKNAR